MLVQGGSPAPPDSHTLLRRFLGACTGPAPASMDGFLHRGCQKRIGSDVPALLTSRVPTMLTGGAHQPLPKAPHRLHGCYHLLGPARLVMYLVNLGNILRSFGASHVQARARPARASARATKPRRARTACSGRGNRAASRGLVF